MNSTEVNLESPHQRQITVWDRPIRLFHWALVVLLPSMWWTAEQGELDWHIALGMVTLALLIFRVLWGFTGSATARFGNFMRGPHAVVGYLRRKGTSDPVIGHNPLGGWSVIAMLLLMLCQIALGLVAGDPDDAAVGPLNHLVSFTISDTATELHQLLFNVIMGIVGLHVGAVLFYLLVRGDNLVRPMVNGRKSVPDDVEHSALVPRTRLFWCMAAAAGAAGWLYYGAPLPWNRGAFVGASTTLEHAR